jgi:hypothetical protein
VAHVVAGVGLGIEEVAELLLCVGQAGGEIAEEVERLLGLGEGEANSAVVEDVNQIVATEGVDLFGSFSVFAGLGFGSIL